MRTKIEYCDEHDSMDTGSVWLCEAVLGELVDDTNPCRMVSMLLVPEGSLVVEKENGEWPTGALAAMNAAFDTLDDKHRESGLDIRIGHPALEPLLPSEDDLVALLDALALVVEGEKP